MNIRMTLVSLLSAIIANSPASAATKTLTVTVEGIGNDGKIADPFALCVANIDGTSSPGSNMRPTIGWSAGPAGTKSYAIVVVDPDVPADFTDAGKPGKIIRNSAKRQPFFHWALIDIPQNITSIAGGDSTIAPSVGQQVKADLSGYVPDAKNFGGPCPPWNDQRIHHYHFTVMALDTDRLELSENATAKDVMTAARAHSIASGKQVGTYTLNPLLIKKR